ncbi:MAG: hypothetical protein ACJ735_06235 [Actinomycetes bacterium]
MEPDPSPTQPTTRGRELRTFLLVLATVWLIASVGAGVWLFTSTKADAVHLRATRPTLTAQSTHDSYGGDAYTGIQNTASDTEHAVVEGSNELAGVSQELADSSAEFNRTLAKRVQQGLGVLVIGVGLLNFTLALKCSAGSQ